MDVDLARMDPILERYEPGDQTALIHALQDIQKTYRYLPEPAVAKVCQHLSIPQARAFSAATFYKAFSLEPRGEHIVRVCAGTTCHIRGAPFVTEELERLLDIEAGNTTKDLKYTLETVNCVGACAMAPVVVVDGDFHDASNPAALSELVKR